MAKKILGAVAALLVLFLAVVAMQPSSFTVKRSLQVDAPAEVVFANLVDFKAWGAWSPWDKLDPNQARTFSEPSSGLGANYHWKGNKDVGEGNMKITELKGNEQLTIELDFIEPFAAHNLTNFELRQSGPGVMVTWSMSGQNDFFGKAAGLFMNMDKMVGGDFERGLGSIKTISEAKVAELKKAADAAAAAEAAKPAEPVDAGTP